MFASLVFVSRASKGGARLPAYQLLLKHEISLILFSEVKDVPDLSVEVMQISESEESEDADESTIIIQSTINQSTYIQEEENLERRRQALLRRK